MNEGVNDQESAVPEKEVPAQNVVSDKELNFRKLEAAREQDREARIRAEMEAQMLRREMEEIKQMLQPKEKDPLDGVEDYVDPARLIAKFDKERSAFERKAKEIAKKTYEELEQQKVENEKKNYLQRLKKDLPDFDQVMNEASISQLEKIDPVFLETVLAVPDDYERRLMTYKKLKSLSKPEEKKSIQTKVVENQQNPYYIPNGSGTPAAVQIDLRSKEAREAAYAKLKAAQRRPIGNGQAPNR